MSLDFQKYNPESARLKGWDYGSNGVYFITICTNANQSFFGDIDVDGKMVLTEMGELAQFNWTYIPTEFSFATLDSFVIMPNHIHGIIIIEKNENQNVQNIVDGGFTKKKNPMLSENISRIIRWYKGRCTYEMRKIHPDFLWQSRFYDHIIRDEQSLDNIRKYIIDNPVNWQYDQYIEFDQWKGEF